MLNTRGMVSDMYRTRELTVKEFLKDRTVIPVYKRSKVTKCEQLEHFCRTTTNHGFAHVVDSDEFFCLRIVWVLVVVALICCLVICVYGNVANLVSGRLTTESVGKDGNQDGSGMLLPDIHICDPSIFKAEFLRDLGFNDTMATYLALATSPQAVVNVSGSTLKKLKVEFEQILAAHFLTIPDLIAKAALKCEDIVVRCAQEEKNYSGRNCCKNFFGNHTYVSIFGACISTHGKAIKQLFASRDAGFVVYIHPNLNDVITFDSELIKLDYVLQEGIYYAVSSPAVHIESVLHTEGRFTSPNAWVSLPITKTFFDNSEIQNTVLSPYSCMFTNDSDYRKQKSAEYDFYSVGNCEASFAQQAYRRHHNCSAVFLKHRNDTQICDPYTISTIDQIEKVPDGWCPPECDIEIFRMSPSYARFNRKLLEKWVNNTNITIPEYVVLHLFYPTFKYQVVVTHVNTWLKFLGEVGGNLGLFLGASLISLMEIIAFIFRCFFKTARKPHNVQ